MKKLFRRLHHPLGIEYKMGICYGKGTRFPQWTYGDHKEMLLCIMPKLKHIHFSRRNGYEENTMTDLNKTEE